MNNWKFTLITGIAVLALSSCSDSSRPLTAADFSQNNYLKAPPEIESILADKKNESSLNVLDVRTPAEFHAGCIGGSRNIDFEAADFATKISGLDKNANYLIYCRTGRRSGLAMTKFRELGFKNMMELKGGITAWSGAGEPVSQNCT